MAKQTDSYYRKAKTEGFAARSVFKLEELDRKYKLFRAGQKILDLGAAPGSWMQYVSERVGEKGLVVAIDRNPLRTQVPANCRVLQADVLAVSSTELKEEFGSFDGLISDLAPQTTGDHEGDHARSVELCRCAFALANDLLVPGGSFVCKMYQGEESKEFLVSLQRSFQTAKIQKPKASRAESREIFFVATSYFRGS
ncbi:MAG: RlmE family RNA methyltransferase [Pseudomonadota bacterium]